MTETKFVSKIDELKALAVKIYKDATPVASGNQRDSIFAKDLPDGGFEIIVGTDYANATNKSGPNAGWIDKAAALFMSQAKLKLSGKINIRSDVK